MQIFRPLQAKVNNVSNGIIINDNSAPKHKVICVYL